MGSDGRATLAIGQRVPTFGKRNVPSIQRRAAGRKAA